jgi:hypothetical protein
MVSVRSRKKTVLNDSHSRRRLPFVVLGMLCVAMGTSRSTIGLASQVPAVNFDVRAAKGLVVSPVYEGWYELDGTTYVLFGYYNRNLEEVVRIPIGSDNKVEPGPIDQAQPTHFFPGRQHGVFAVAIPKDRPRTEMIWTLTANGHTLSIPATLDRLYFISPQKDDGGVHPGNTPPLLKFDPSGPSARGPLGMTISRTATVSRPLTVDVWVTDTEPPPARAVPVSPTSRTLPRGLTVSWRLYRGPGSVSFSNPTPALEHGGKAQTTVTFGEVGDYVLHVLALESRSGTKCCWTNGYVKVAVDAGAPDR